MKAGAKHILTAAALTCAIPFAAKADFVESNVLAIFYHELCHAVIDQMGVPIFGQEEDAADTLSILLIDALYEPDVAEDLAYDSAALFFAESQTNEATFWDTHGPDEQRFFNTVCLFYGGAPDTRVEFAQDMDLPEERADSCEEEFALAADSWNAVLDEMTDTATGSGALINTGLSAFPILQDEVAALNEEFNWPRNVIVRAESCGEPNAYYDPNDGSITMCTELTDWLTELNPFTE
jgi:hypothetical protein